jgi:Transcriptional regulator, AbiEi antitoxin
MSVKTPTIQEHRIAADVSGSFEGGLLRSATPAQYIAVMADGWTAALTIADEQWGLLTKQQIETTGVTWTALERRVRQGYLERVARGVYRVRGSGEPDQLDLRAAWLQLDPAVPAWERTTADGVVSHRSAAALYGIGHLAADRHEFTFSGRRQTRRADVRLHHRLLDHSDCTQRGGLPVTRPSRIAADLLAEREDLGAVAQLITDALRSAYDDLIAMISAIAPYAAAHGSGRDDGLGFLHRLLELSGDPESDRWRAEADAINRGRNGDARGAI